MGCVAAAVGGGLMGKLRRWNIINDSDDCGPVDGSSSIRFVPKPEETRNVIVAALKVGQGGGRGVKVQGRWRL